MFYSTLSSIFLTPGQVQGSLRTKPSQINRRVMTIKCCTPALWPVSQHCTPALLPVTDQVALERDSETKFTLKEVFLGSMSMEGRERMLGQRDAKLLCNLSADLAAESPGPGVALWLFCIKSRKQAFYYSPWAVTGGLWVKQSPPCYYLILGDKHMKSIL